jgi:TolB-like protein
MNLIGELKRRNVFKVAIAYLVASWLIIQLADILVPMLTLPDWVSRFIFLLLVVLFIPTLIAAWALELTPDGLKLEKNVDRAQSITPQTGQKLNHMIIGVLALAVVVLLIDKVWLSGSEAPATDASATAEKSVAVLPFADLSQNQDQEWFADGLAEEILNALARTPDLLISARTSTFAYKGTDKDIPTIARELGVAHVLEGSVRRAGERIRVTAQLIRAADGFHLWSQNYDRDATDVIEIQEDLAIQIANALETTMDPETLKDMVRVGTSSVEAYQAYIHGAALRAEALLENNNRRMIEAYEYFEEARARDPQFSHAHGAAAQHWVLQMTLTSFYMDTTEATPLADMQQLFYERNDTAIATARNEADAIYLRAKRADVDLRFREAMRLYRQYLELRPNDLIAWEAYLDTATSASAYDAINEALEVLREAGLTRPEAASYFMDYAYLHLDPDDGSDYGLTAMQRWPLANIMYQTHRNLLFAQRIEEARQVMQAFEQRYGQAHPLSLARQACAENRVEAVREINETRYGAGDTVNSGNPKWLVLKMLGEEEEALRILRSFEQQAPFLMANWLSYTHFDPAPFPGLMRILERENVDRPPAITLPYACTPKPQN